MAVFLFTISDYPICMRHGVLTRRSSEREPADSLTGKSSVIGGWLPSLTFAFGAARFRA